MVADGVVHVRFKMIDGSLPDRLVEGCRGNMTRGQEKGRRSDWKAALANRSSFGLLTVPLFASAKGEDAALQIHRVGF